MARPTEHLDWVTDDDEDAIEAPSPAKREEGWVADEKPPYEWFNWLFNRIDKWIKFFVNEHVDVNTAHGATGAVVGTTNTQTLSNKTISGSSNTISNINLAASVTGTLPIANGGTGDATGSAGNILTYSGGWSSTITGLKLWSINASTPITTATCLDSSGGSEVGSTSTVAMFGDREAYARFSIISTVGAINLNSIIKNSYGEFIRVGAIQMDGYSEGGNESGSYELKLKPGGLTAATRVHQIVQDGTHVIGTSGGTTTHQVNGSLSLTGVPIWGTAPVTGLKLWSRDPSSPMTGYTFKDTNGGADVATTYMAAGFGYDEARGRMTLGGTSSTTGSILNFGYKNASGQLIRGGFLLFNSSSTTTAGAETGMYQVSIKPAGSGPIAAHSIDSNGNHTIGNANSSGHTFTGGVTASGDIHATGSSIYANNAYIANYTETGYISATAATASSFSGGFTSQGVSSVSGANSTSYMLTVAPTTAASPYGIRVREPASPTSGYPLLNVTNNAGTTEYLRVNSGSGSLTASSSSATMGYGAGCVTVNNSSGSSASVVLGVSGSRTTAIYSNATYPFAVTDSAGADTAYVTGATKVWSFMGGIKLPGGTAAVLNHYEEGVFTPTIATTGTQWSSVTYANQVAAFTRIGRCVFFSFQVMWTNTSGTPSGVMIIMGLPYAAKNTSGLYNSIAIQCHNIDAPGTRGSFIGEVDPGVSYMYVVAAGDNTATQTCDPLANGGAVTRQILGSGFYFV